MAAQLSLSALVRNYRDVSHVVFLHHGGTEGFLSCPSGDVDGQKQPAPTGKK